MCKYVRLARVPSPDREDLKLIPGQLAFDEGMPKQCFVYSYFSTGLQLAEALEYLILAGSSQLMLLALARQNHWEIIQISLQDALAHLSLRP